MTNIERHYIFVVELHLHVYKKVIQILALFDDFLGKRFDIQKISPVNAKPNFYPPHHAQHIVTCISIYVAICKYVLGKSCFAIHKKFQYFSSINKSKLTPAV